MQSLEQLRQSLPEFAKDIKLNLQSVLASEHLNASQRWGVALTCAATSEHPELLRLIMEAASEHIERDVIDDALAAATLMRMNNVFYRFRHIVGKESYSKKPARLRMNRIARPATNKVDFELFCLAASAINNCELCVKSHEQVVTQHEISEDAVLDTIRIAATIHATANALRLSAWDTQTVH